MWGRISASSALLYTFILKPLAGIKAVWTCELISLLKHPVNCPVLFVVFSVYGLFFIIGIIQIIPTFFRSSCCLNCISDYMRIKRENLMWGYY